MLHLNEWAIGTASDFGRRLPADIGDGAVSGGGDFGGRRLARDLLLLRVRRKIEAVAGDAAVGAVAAVVSAEATFIPGTGWGRGSHLGQQDPSPQRHAEIEVNHNVREANPLLAVGADRRRADIECGHHTGGRDRDHVRFAAGPPDLAAGQRPALQIGDRGSQRCTRPDPQSQL